MKKIIYIPLIIVVVFGVIYLFVSNPISISTNIDRINDWCKIQNITYCYIQTPECFNNCQNLGLKYFRFDNSGFGSNECWCLKNGEPIQIW